MSSEWALGLSSWGVSVATHTLQVRRRRWYRARATAVKKTSIISSTQPQRAVQACRMETKTKHEALAVDDSAVYNKSPRGSATACWMKLFAVLLLVSIVCFLVYEHVRLNKLEQRQCTVAGADRDRDVYNDDQVRLSLSGSGAEIPSCSGTRLLSFPHSVNLTRLPT